MNSQETTAYQHPDGGKVTYDHKLEILELHSEDGRDMVGIGIAPDGLVELGARLIELGHADASHTTTDWVLHPDGGSLTYNAATETILACDEHGSVIVVPISPPELCKMAANVALLVASLMEVAP